MGWPAGEGTAQSSVRDVASFGEITAGMLRETFPQWRIFTGGGVWWATRGGMQEWAGPRALLMRVLGAGDLTTLTEKLCLQERLDGLDAEALAEVYRGTLLGSDE